MANLEAAERLDPGYYRPPYNRGLLLEEDGRWEEAADAYRRSVEREPRYLLGRAALAQALLALGRTEEAAAELDAIRDYEGRWEDENHAIARARADRMLAWLAEHRRAAELGIPDCFAESAVFRRAEIARLEGRNEEAMALLREYFEGGGTCVSAHRALGGVLLEARRLDDARAAFERALAKAAVPGAHLGLAQIAAVGGDAGLAVRHLEAELEVDPRSAAAWLEMGLVAERLLRDQARAAAAFERFRAAGGSPELLEARRRASVARRPEGASRPD
jgi:tetratricopeptide (TPR) repeat protein